MDNLLDDLRRSAAAFERSVARFDRAAEPVEREAARAEMDQLRVDGEALLNRLRARTDETLGALSPKLRDLVSGARSVLPRAFETGRRELNRVETTGLIEDALTDGLDALLAEVPPGWLAKEEAKGGHRLTTEDLARPFSVVSNVRVGAATGQHPFARALLQARDFAGQRADRDAFASALSVAEVARLGQLLTVLRGVPGADDRLRRLRGRDAPAAMNALYELIVAGALAEFGRDVAFVPEASTKTPDLRVYDDTGISTFVECKRKRGLTDVEVAEEDTVRGLFAELDAWARRAGVFGTFDAEFEVSPVVVASAEFASAAAVAVRRPNSPTREAWGTVTFCPTPADVPTGLTIAYGPLLLRRAFGYNAWTPTTDGLVCRVDPPPGRLVDRATRPLGLSWTSTGTESVRARARPLSSLFAKAVQQYPAGSVGITYLAYEDGGRPDVSDERVRFILAGMKETELRRPVHLPAVFVNRLVARLFDHGAPDVVENALQLADSHGGEAWIDEFPSTVYTKPTVS